MFFTWILIMEKFYKKKFYKSLANPTALFKRERFIYVCYKNHTGKRLMVDYGNMQQWIYSLV